MSAEHTLAPGLEMREEVALPSVHEVFGGRYAVEAELARGGMGRVLRGRDLKLDRPVAIKLLAPGPHTDSQRRRFEQEARAAGALNHPNIIDVHDVGEQQGEPYIITELLEGESLRDVLRRGPLREEQALDFALQLGSGLAAAHRAGIVHRDVKPENLFVTPDGRLKILDFGIAKLLESEQPAVRTATGTHLGTPAYMSPEQVRGEPADARSDVFACGAVLYEMLSGRPAFDAASTAETGYAILHDPPEMLPRSRLTPVIARCLEKDPRARYANAGELLGDVRAIGQRDRWLRARRLRRRVSVMAALGIVATLALAEALRRHSAAPRASRLRIAVADFVNETDDKDLSGLSGMMITALGQSKRLSVLTRGTMYDLLGQAANQAERIDETLARELTRRTALDGLVLVSIRRFGEVYAIDAKVLDPSRNEYVVVAKDQGRGKEEVPALIDHVSERIRAGLTEAAEEVRSQSVPVARTTTANLEAYRHFFAGDALVLRGKFEAARAEFRAAIALDPDFALAYLHLSNAQDWTEPNAEFDAALLKALEMADRLPLSELCTARAAEALYRHRPADATAQQIRCATAYPDDLGAVRLAADYAWHSADWDTAERLFLMVRPADSVDEWADLHLWGIWSWVRRDDARLLADSTERAAKTQAAIAYAHLAWAYAAVGDRMALERTLDELLRRNPDDRAKRELCALRVLPPLFDAEPERAEAMVAGECAGAEVRHAVDLARGRYRSLATALDAEVTAAAHRGDKRLATIGVRSKARLSSLWGDGGAWREGVAAARAFAPGGEQMFELHVMSGDPDALTQLRDAHELPRLTEFDLDAYIALARARREGRVDAQIAAYEQLSRVTASYELDLARVQLRSGNPRKAIATLQRQLLARPWPIWRGGPLWIRIFQIPHGLHDLGVAYEQIGDKAAARDAYARLLRLWSDADPDLPDLVDAKARYAALGK